MLKPSSLTGSESAGVIYSERLNSPFEEVCCFIRRLTGIIMAPRGNRFDPIFGSGNILTDYNLMHKLRDICRKHCVKLRFNLSYGCKKVMFKAESVRFDIYIFHLCFVERIGGVIVEGKVGRCSGRGMVGMGKVEIAVQD